MRGGVLAGSVSGALPFLGFRHGSANPKDQQSWQHTNQEQKPRRGCRQKEVRQSSGQNADIYSGLQHGSDPGTPLPWPRFGEQRSSDCPFPTDTQSREEPENEQVPPGLGEEGEPGKKRVGQNGQAQRARAPQTVSDPAEEAAAQSPAQQEPALNQGTIVPNPSVCSGFGADELRHERRSHQGVKMHVQAVEGPPKPRSNSGAPLLRAESAQRHRSASRGWPAGVCRFHAVRRMVNESEFKTKQIFTAGG